MQKVSNLSTAVNTSLTLFLRIGKSHILYAQRPQSGVHGGIASVEKLVFYTNFYILTVCPLIHIYIYTKFQISGQTTNCGAKGHLPIIFGHIGALKMGLGKFEGGGLGSSANSIYILY